jgi:tetratricopeptide (TPR) repeat protein
VPAIQLDSNYSAAYKYRSNSRHLLGDNQGALRDAKKIIQLNLNDSTSYRFRGNYRYFSGDNQGAIKDLVMF